MPLSVPVLVGRENGMFQAENASAPWVDLFRS